MKMRIHYLGELDKNEILISCVRIVFVRLIIEIRCNR